MLTHLSHHELIDYLLGELPASSAGPERPYDVEESETNGDGSARSLIENPSDERCPLLWDRRLSTMKFQNDSPPSSDGMLHSFDDDLTLPFIGSNALEIAAIADAKNFLSQRVVQKIITGIWSGDIVFWESLSVYSKKKAQVYNEKYGFSCLRICL